MNLKREWPMQIMSLMDWSSSRTIQKLYWNNFRIKFEVIKNTNVFNNWSNAKKKLRWAGHILSKVEDKLEKAATFQWLVYDTRKARIPRNSKGFLKSVFVTCKIYMRSENGVCWQDFLLPLLLTGGQCHLKQFYTHRTAERSKPCEFAMSHSHQV